MRNLILTFLLLSFCLSHAQPLIGFESFASGFSKPVDITHAGDPRMFVVEQAGRIRILNPNGQFNGTPFLDIRSRVNDRRSEQGLLGLAFHPDYASNGYFFVNYTDGNGSTRISRFERDPSNPNLALPGSESPLLVIPQPFSNHNAGQLQFGPDGYLYIGTGDGGSGGDPGNRSQDGLNLLGKMLRIDVDGPIPYGIPADNPFVNDSGVRDEIWALGLRNPWRFSFDPLNGDLWIADVGQNDWEEVSRQPGGSPGGENYGWRCYEGNSPYNPGGCGPMGSYTAPTFVYDNSLSFGKSVTGGYVYRGQDHPGLYGHYVFADYETGHIWLTQVDSLQAFPTTFQPQSTYRAISTFGVDAQGELYAADHTRGIIYRVTDQRTSLEQFPLAELVQLSPNPFGAQLRLRFRQGLQGEVAIRLLDVTGQVVWNQQGKMPGELTIERQGWAAGLYLLEVQHQGKVYRGKVMAR